MTEFLVKSYEPGFEEEQTKIGSEIIRNWVWPYQYNLEFLRKYYTSEDFDPETAYDERKEIYRLSGKIVKTQSCVQTAEGDKNGLWTTVLAAAVFIM